VFEKEKDVTTSTQSGWSSFSLRYSLPHKSPLLSISYRNAFFAVIFSSILISSSLVQTNPVLAATGTLEPASGYAGTVITVKCTGLIKNVSGWVWFDSNINGIRDDDEPQIAVTSTGFGTLPAGTTLVTPSLLPGDYPVRVDVPEGAPIEASPLFTILPPSITLSPSSGISGTEITVTGGGVAPDTAGWVWFDSNDDGVRDAGEPQLSISTTTDGNIPAGTSLTAPAVAPDVYSVMVDIPAGGDIEASKSFTVLPAAISLNPPSGFMDSVITITVTGGSFAADNTGYIWFDTNNNSVRDPDEPQVSVMTTEIGTIPEGTTLDSPLLPPNVSYQVRADIPEGGTIEASATFTTTLTTTSLRITKHDPYGSILSEETIDYQSMRDYLTVHGDGTTHQYLQGPTFDPENLWDPEEVVNIKDWGANKGTDLKDLCELVGGMSDGDTVRIISSDGLHRTYDYPNVYHPDPRQGKIVVAWWNNGSYVPAFNDGLRLLFFAETTNPDGYYVFGNWDQHECFPQSRWYFFGGEYPTTTGHSVKYIYDIEIRQPNLVSCDAYGGPKSEFKPGDTVYVKGLGLAAAVSYDLWIQSEPILEGASLSTGNDPSGSQETVTTDGNGDFGPTAIWTIPSGAPEADYDIVADNQASGTVGSYDASDAIDSPGWAGFSVTTPPAEHISFTVTDYGNDGIIFGSLDPGMIDQPADGQPGQGTVTLTVGEETNVDVAVQLKGDDFTGPATIDIGSVKYDSDSDPDGAATLTDSYVTWYTVSQPLSGDDVREVYHWISIPGGKPAGTYTSTFYYQAVKSP